MNIEPQLLQPYTALGGPTGCLLVHGFSSAPPDVLPLARYLHSHMGMSVHCPVLPGHSTTPEDMARYNEQDWLKSVEQGVELLQKHCSRIWLAGFSMGGVLCLVTAARKQVSGVISLAAPVWPVPFVSRFSRVLEHTRPWLPMGQRPPMEEPSWRYDRVAAKNVTDLYRLINLLKSCLPQVDKPVLVVQGGRDRTVRPASGRYIYKNLGSEDKELEWIDDSGHLLLLGRNRQQLINHCAHFIEQRLGGLENGSYKESRRTGL